MQKQEIPRVPRKNFVNYPVEVKSWEEYTFLDIIVYILGRSSDSYLNKILREEMGITYGVYAYALHEGDICSLCIMTSAKQENAHLVYGAIQKAFKLFLQNLNEEMLKDCTNEIITKKAFSAESVESVRDQTSYLFRTFNCVKSIEDYMEFFNTINVDDLKSDLKRIVSSKPYITTLYPEKEGSMDFLEDASFS